jgi:hypothetical protein
MTDEDKAAIVAFAKGDASMRDAAIAAHRRCIPTDGVRGNIYQEFMAEVDNPCPDTWLRADARRRLLEASHD